VTWGLAEAWEANAGEWIAWARKPDHDGFWQGTWPELRAILPGPDGVTVEVGCGEGRVSRQLTADGHRVVAVEQSPTLAAAARSGPAPIDVIRSDATALPLPTASVGLVVACMVFQDVDDLDGAAAEVGRVLRPNGNLCFAIVHPFSSAQDPVTLRTGRPTPITTPYLVERRYEDRAERDGVTMTFVSAHRPLSAYVAALGGAGLATTAIREFGSREIPWLLVGRAIKMPDGPSS
jgi:SAM-dependent methyltransferase